MLVFGMKYICLNSFIAAMIYRYEFSFSFSLGLGQVTAQHMRPIITLDIRLISKVLAKIQNIKQSYFFVFTLEDIPNPLVLGIQPCLSTLL